MSIQLKISSLTGGQSDHVDVSEGNFDTGFNEALIHQVVVAYQAGGRSGTRAQKNRADVRGGGAKPWRQRAQGGQELVQPAAQFFRGGGRTFPASTQSFEQKVNKKMYRAAMRSILSELNRQDRLVIVDELVIETPKTSALVGHLSKLDAPDVLLVLSETDKNVELSARNLRSVQVCNSNEINPVSLISQEKVVMTVDAAKKIDEALQ